MAAVSKICVLNMDMINLVVAPMIVIMVKIYIYERKKYFLFHQLQKVDKFMATQSMVNKSCVVVRYDKSVSHHNVLFRVVGSYP